MSKQERVHIYIDAGNFYHLVLKKLGIQETDFDFERFSIFLANGRTITKNGKRFYVGTVREKEGDEKSKIAMARQNSLFSALKKGEWEIKPSKLRLRTETVFIDKRVVDYQKIRKAGIDRIVFEKFREKGVDVKLATDLIVGAVDDQYDVAIVVSSDSDLVPAIDWVRFRFQKKKKVEYVGFSILDEHNPKNSTEPTLNLISKTDIKRILVRSDVEQFIIASLFKSKQEK
jgi:uncharacterized LabA/DUF88 family protein